MSNIVTDTDMRGRTAAQTGWARWRGRSQNGSQAGSVRQGRTVPTEKQRDSREQADAGRGCKDSTDRQVEVTQEHRGDLGWAWVGLG